MKILSSWTLTVLVAFLAVLVCRPVAFVLSDFGRFRSARGKLISSKSHFKMTAEDTSSKDTAESVPAFLLWIERMLFPSRSADMARWDAHFDRIDAHFDRIDARFGHLNAQLDGLGTKIQNLTDVVLTKEDLFDYYNDVFDIHRGPEN